MIPLNIYRVRASCFSSAMSQPITKKFVPGSNEIFPNTGEVVISSAVEVNTSLGSAMTHLVLSSLMDMYQSDKEENNTVVRTL